MGRQPAPTRLSSDHDPLYRFHQWQANLRILDVEAVETVPYVAALTSTRRFTRGCGTMGNSPPTRLRSFKRVKLVP